MYFSQSIQPVKLKGRGSQINPDHRFSKQERSEDADHYFHDPDENISPRTQVIDVYPKTIVNKVDSPDVGLTYSLNPYQGCEHGCVYCYARPTHNYWGYSSGLDFETKIMVKRNAAELLEKKIKSSRYDPAPILLSGNTDCYQPVEKEQKITREVLEVLHRYRHPVGIVTKNRLILRDLDLLTDMAKDGLVNVAISLNTLEDGLRRLLEPRASSVAKRLGLIESLSKAGIPVTVLAAPIIPGLNDDEILPLAKKVAEAGARRLHHIVVRLNNDLDKIFENWLEVHYQDRKSKVLNKIKSLHGGRLNDSRMGIRMKGEGKIAEIINQQFSLAKKLYMLDNEKFEYNMDLFTHGRDKQLTLF